MVESISHREYEYIRYALDVMKRTASPDEQAHWGDSAQAGKLAQFASAVRFAYSARDYPYANALELETAILAMLKHSNFSREPEFRTRDEPGSIPTGESRAAFTIFCQQLFDRLNDKEHVQNTAAWIAYEMGIRGKFFSENNHLITQAVETYVLMRHGQRLPVYRASPEKLAEEKRHAAETQDFARWQAFYKKQFTHLDPIKARKAEKPRDAWHVYAGHLFDPQSTVCDKRYALRDADELAQLQFVTGKYPQKLAVFKPSRMALHETVAALVTRVQMKDPKNEIEDFIKRDPIYQSILEQVAPLDQEIEISPGIKKSQFTRMSRRFEEYARYLVSDHFHILNPQAELRQRLQEEKDNILQRIKDKKYNPRLVESEDSLKRLLGDYMLKEHYQAIVRGIAGAVCFI